MPRFGPLILAGLCLTAGPTSAVAQADPIPPPDQDVHTVAVIHDQVVRDETTAAAASGLQQGVRPESDAESARRNAREALVAKTEVGRRMPVNAPASTRTTIVADDVVAVTESPSNSAACTQIGVIGADPACRPPR